jgi:hypothetical protein
MLKKTRTSVGLKQGKSESEWTAAGNKNNISEGHGHNITSRDMFPDN